MPRWTRHRKHSSECAIAASRARPRTSGFKKPWHISEHACRTGCWHRCIRDAVRTLGADSSSNPPFLTQVPRQTVQPGVVRHAKITQKFVQTIATTRICGETGHVAVRPHRTLDAIARQISPLGCRVGTTRTQNRCPGTRGAVRTRRTQKHGTVNGTRRAIVALATLPCALFRFIGGAPRPSRAEFAFVLTPPFAVLPRRTFNWNYGPWPASVSRRTRLTAR